MSMADCLRKLKDYINKSGLAGSIPPRRLDYFARRLEKIRAEALTPSEFAAKANEFIEQDTVREAAKRRAANAMILVKRQEDLAQIRANIKDWQANPKKFGASEKMPTEALRVWQEGGSLRPGEGTNMSQPVMRDSIHKELLRFMKQAIADTNIPGLKVAVESGRLDHDTWLEMEALVNKAGVGKTNNPMALEYAKALKAVGDKILSRQQAINPYMDRLEDFLFRQSYNQEKVTQMGREDFVNLMMEKASKKSFLDLDDAEKSEKFGEMFDKIQSGRRQGIVDDSNSDKLITVHGSGSNIMKRMSSSRVVHFDDAQAAYDVMSQVGPATLWEGMLDRIHQASGDISWLEKAGPNPDGMRAGLVERIRSGLKGKALDQFDRDKVKLDRRWDAMRGAQYAPAYGWAARRTQGLLALQYAAKAMGAVLHSGQDLVMTASLMRNFDRSNLFGNVFEAAGNFLKYFASTSMRQEHMENFGQLANSVRMEMMRSLGSPDSAPGTMSRIANLGGKLSFFNRFHESVSAAVGEMLTKRLGYVADTEHAALPASWKQGLERYNIKPWEWDLLRQHPEEFGGRKRLSPDSVQAIPDEKIKQHLSSIGLEDPQPQMVDRVRDRLSMKLGTMINENALLGSARTDARQKNFMWEDTNINEGWGMVRRAVSQFKAASLTMLDVGRRGYFSSTTDKGDLSGYAQYIAANASMYGLGYALQQLAMGKTPEDPTSPAFLAKMAAGSGATGQYADGLVDMMQQNSPRDKAASLVKGIAGPAISFVADTAATVGQGIQEASGHYKGRPQFANSAVNLGIGNLPFHTLPYIKPLLDYYILNAMREWASPGANARAEKRLTNEPALGGGNRQYLFGKPTGATFLGR